MYVGSCSERQKNEEEAMNEMTYNEAIEWMDSRHWSGTGKGIVRSQWINCYKLDIVVL